MKDFRNVIVFRLEEPLNLSEEELNDRLRDYRSEEPASVQTHTVGFVEPYGNDDVYAEAVTYLRGKDHKVSFGEDPAGVGFLIHVRTISRVIPNKAVQRAVAEKVKAIEERDSRKVYGTERATIKQDIVAAMLPRAFTAADDVLAYIHYDLIFIGSLSASKAETVLGALREALGSLKARPIMTRLDPVNQMTHWAMHNDTRIPELALGNSFKVEDIFESGSTLSGSHLELSKYQSDADLLSDLTQDRHVTSLGLILTDPELGDTHFVLTKQLRIKGIRWSEEFSYSIEDHVGCGNEDPIAYRQVSDMLAMSMLRHLFVTLVEALGGLNKGVSINESFGGKPKDNSVEDYL